MNCSFCRAGPQVRVAVVRKEQRTEGPYDCPSPKIHRQYISIDDFHYQQLSDLHPQSAFSCGGFACYLQPVIHIFLVAHFSCLTSEPVLQALELDSLSVVLHLGPTIF